MANTNLQAAKTAKKDEFYTQLTDIEKELRHYKEHFRDKVVLCNCDDPRVSNFVRYFVLNFEHLGLKRLISTCYKHQDIDLFGDHSEEKAVYLIYEGGKDDNGAPDFNKLDVLPLKGDGDFRSQECIELLKQADIVVTNPPFSLFREYVAQLMKYEKKFLIIGNQNNVTTKEIFPLIQNKNIWLGVNSGSQTFDVPESYDGNNIKLINGERKACFGNICWYTNLDFPQRHEEITLFRKYDKEKYPQYDNFDAIEVCFYNEIPEDYFGIMGMSPTFMTKYCPDQFDIIGITKTWYGLANKKYPKQLQYSKNGDIKEVSKLNDGAVLKVSQIPDKDTYYMIDNNIYIQTYPRILIRRKQ